MLQEQDYIRIWEELSASGTLSRPWSSLTEKEKTEVLTFAKEVHRKTLAEALLKMIKKRKKK